MNERTEKSPKEAHDAQNLYFIKAWFNPAPPKLVEISGGWIPVATDVPNGTAVCIFESMAHAEAYAENERTIPTPAFMKIGFEVAPFNPEELMRVSRKLGHAFVSLDPSFGPDGPQSETFGPMDSLPIE